MVRPPPWLWVLAPLALALLYTAAHALLAPRPGVDDVVPGEAVVTVRFRGTAALDRLWFFGRPEEGRPSELLGRQRNVPGLAGVNPTGAIHFVLLPRGGRADNTLAIFPLQDADAFRDAFEGRAEEALGRPRLERNAQELEIHGRFAAVAWDRDIVRRLGEGGLTCEDRGEDLALAVDVPQTAALALLSAGGQPWQPLVLALGAEPARAVMGSDAATGQRKAEFPAGRVPLVASTWRTARLWAYLERRALEAELEPAPASALARLLEQAAAEPPAPLGAAPREALAWFEIPGGAARLALTEALRGAGVRLPPLPGIGAGGAFSGFALPNLENGRSWTWVLSGQAATLEGLTPLLGPLPAPGAAQDLEAGAAPFTLSDTRGSGPAPKAVLLRADWPPPGGPALLLGLDALRHAARLPLLDRAPGPEPAPEPDGWRLLARLGVSAERAPDLLGGALSPGGLLAVLDGGPLEGEVATDGRRLRVRLRVVPRAP